MTLNVSGSITSTVPAVLLGTYTRGGSSQSGQGTTPDMVFAYTLSWLTGSGACWTSGAGSRRAGSVLDATPEGWLTLGAVHTTAKTTAAGLTIASTKTAAEAMRTARDRTSEARVLLVGKIFKLGGELAYPSTVVETADEATVALVACDVQELLLSDQRPEPGQVRIRAVSHDPADHARKLAPLSLGQRFAVAGDRDQEGGRGPGDRVRKQLLRLGAGDDLAARADDVGDPVPAHPDDVATTADCRAFEVSGSCFHTATAYCNCPN